MMKRTGILLVLVALLVIGGCSEVTMSPKYAQLLDQTAAWAEVAAGRAEAGEMTPDEQTRALRQSATMWAEFQKARDGGKGGDGQ